LLWRLRIRTKCRRFWPLHPCWFSTVQLVFTPQTVDRLRCWSWSRRCPAGSRTALAPTPQDGRGYCPIAQWPKVDHTMSKHHLITPTSLDAWAKCLNPTLCVTATNRPASADHLRAFTSVIECKPLDVFLWMWNLNPRVCSLAPMHRIHNASNNGEQLRSMKSLRMGFSLRRGFTSLENITAFFHIYDPRRDLSEPARTSTILGRYPAMGRSTGTV
jgi:hypothetical protein